MVIPYSVEELVIFDEHQRDVTGTVMCARVGLNDLSAARHTELSTGEDGKHQRKRTRFSNDYVLLYGYINYI